MKAPSSFRKSDKSDGLCNKTNLCQRGRVSSLSSFRRALYFVIFTILLAALFIRPLCSLVIHVLQSDLHSYILLVPFISAYLLYIRRQQLPKDYVPSFGFSLASLVIGLTALAAALRAIPSLTQNDYLGLMAFSSVCFLAAGGFFFLGRKWMAAAVFPFAFLFFIVPLPNAAADFLREVSKIASAETASLFFNLTGTPLFRDGAVFQLPTIVIEVSEECSGIRSSWILLITSILAANLFLKSSWRRIVLVSVVIPLGILRNGFRILVIGLLCIHVGPQMIHSVIHHKGGPLFFALSLIPVFLLMWWMRGSETRSNGLGKAKPAKNESG